MSGNLTPEVRIDKNGKAVTKHVKTQQSAKSTSKKVAPAQPPVVAVSDDDTSPLSTNDLYDAINALGSPEFSKDAKTREKRRREHRQKIEALEERWSRALAQEYASDIPPELQKVVFNEAREEGIAYGYQEVEYRYESTARFARLLYKELNRPA